MVHQNYVSNAILQIIESSERFLSETINIALTESITLELLLNTIATCLNITEPINFEIDEESAWYKYPTGGQGPLNISKYNKLFTSNNNNLLSFKESVCKTVMFYENAMTDLNYAKDRELMLAEFIEEVLPDTFTDVDLLIDVFVRAYGSKVFEGIDIGLYPEDNNDVKQIESKHQEL